MIRAFSTVFLPVVCLSLPPNRTLNGSGNNLANLQLGSSGTPFIGGGIYADPGLSAINSRLPSARNVSAVIFSPDTPFSYSRLGFSYLLTAWGQLVAHDLAQATAGVAINDSVVGIPVPRCDKLYDPECTGTQVLPFTRSTAVSGVTGPRRQVNAASHFLDGSVLYGNDVARCGALREGRGGRMLLDKDGNAPANLVPSGSDFNPHVNVASLRSFGDPRGNIDPGILSVYTALLREHNWQANATAVAYPHWSDDDIFNVRGFPARNVSLTYPRQHDFFLLVQMARAWVIAEIQAITFGEYAASILGTPLSQYMGYNASVDPSVSGK